MSLERNDLARGECFAQVALRFRFTIGLEVLKIYGPVLLPDRLSSFFIKRDEELMIAAVEIQNKKSVVQNWRRPGATIVIAFEIPTTPQNFSGMSVQTGGAWRAKGDINAAVLDDRSWRSIAVERMRVLRLLHFE